MSGRPASDDIRGALETIVSSTTFARSERARDLLTYLVEKELAGEAERLKGFSIGVDVFGKDSGFDPATDAVVRVQAGRLRQLLQQFYDDEAPPELVRIDIPRGTYVPAYDGSADAPPANGAAEAAEPPEVTDIDHIEGEPAGPLKPRVSGIENLQRPEAANFDLADTLQRIETQQKTAIARPLSRHFGLLWIAMAVVIGMLALLVYSLGPYRFGDEEGTGARGEEQDSAAAALLPMVHVSAQQQSRAVQRVEAAVRAALPAFDAVSYVSRLPEDATGPRRYMFMISEGAETDIVNLSLENIARGAVLWSGRINTNHPGHTISQQVADILSITMSDDGVLYAFIAANGLETSLTRCLLLDSAYFKEQNDANHRAAYDCFHDLAKAGAKSPIVYSELAMLTQEAVTGRRDYPADVSVAMALDQAKRAVRLGPQSAYAHRAMGFVLSRLGNRSEAVRWARKAHALNPSDLALAAGYGHTLVMTAGQYQEAARVLDRAVSASSSHPDSWIYALFLARYAGGDSQGAFRLVDRLRNVDQPQYVALRLIAAAETGNELERQRLRALLHEDHPDFSTDPGAYFRRAGYHDDLIATLQTALARAGLGQPA